MAEHSNGSLDSRTLAARKNKRLEEALSAFSQENTKQTVSKLLEEFVDESGKNYFGAGTRDTTLYFADEEYIKEIEKEKEQSKASKEEKIEKTSVVDKLHKLTSIIPKHDTKAETKDESSNPQIDTEISEEVKDLSTEKSDETNIKKESISEDTNNDTLVVEEASAKEEINTNASENNTENEPAAITQENLPEPEPTIVITPVKTEDIKKEAPAEEDTKEMRREFFDNEIEVDAVPRRRRKSSETETTSPEDKSIPPIDIDDTEDEDFDDYEEDYEDEKEEKKNKFGNFFKRKKKDDPFDDEDDFDDEDFDDDFDDDYYDDEDGSSTFKKVLNAIVIIALVCSTAFFAASNYTNSKKLESANTQINELNNNNTGSSDEQISELQSQIDALTAENERLKNGSTVQSETSAEASSSATPASTTITGSAPTDENGTTTGSGSTYTIKSGDTGSRICNAVYGQYTEELWQQILEANGMTTSTVYHPGDVLQIP